MGTDSVIKAWRLTTGDLLTTMATRHDANPSCMTAVVNYSSKIVIGTHQGHLELWNFNSGVMVHKFEGFGCQITALASSPAADTIGVGLADGRVICYNLLHGKALLTFQHGTASQKGKRKPIVTSLSFRMDGVQTLVSATDRGDVAVWNLSKQKLEGLLTSSLQAASQDEVFEPPHNGRVTLAHFLPMEPVLVTSGTDNSVRMYVFDKLQGTGKLLRERRGHYMSCTGTLFFDPRIMLSVGSDRTLRVNHVFSDVFNREMSQGSVVKEARKRQVATLDLRLPPITVYDASSHRMHDWSSVVTGHKGSGTAYLWKMNTLSIANKKESMLRSPDSRDREAEVSAIAITRCANFAIIGLSSGRIHHYNLQSQLHKKSYCDSDLESSRAHTGRVTGVYVARDNDLIVSVGLDSFIRIWSFPSVNLKYRLSLEGGHQALLGSFNSANQFLAIATEKHLINVYDMTPHNMITADEVSATTTLTKAEGVLDAVSVRNARLVRSFKKHTSNITSMVSSTDNRLIFSASLDSTLCVWDVPTDRLIDCILFPTPITSLGMHPESYFLSTTHANDENIYLWTNKMRYGHIPASAAGKQATGLETRELYDMPEVSIDGFIEHGDGSEVKLFDVENPEINTEQKLTESEKQLIEKQTKQYPGVISYSDAPSTKWITLTSLDQIKKRNAPIAPPKKIDAPFFLPLGTATTEVSPTESKILNTLKDDALVAQTETPFVRLLINSDNEGALLLLKDMGAAKVDIEFTSLVDTLSGLDDSTDDELSSENERRLLLVTTFFEQMLATRNDFEYVQALLTLFIRKTGLVASRISSLQSRFARLESLQKDNADLLGSLVDNSLALIRHFVAPV